MLDGSVSQIDIGETWIPILNNIIAKTNEDQLLCDTGKNILLKTEDLVRAKSDQFKRYDKPREVRLTLNEVDNLELDHQILQNRDTNNSK